MRLFALQEAIASQPRAYSIAPARGLALLLTPLWCQIVGRCRERCWTKGACQSSEGVDPSKSLQKLGKLIGYFEKAPGLSQTQANTWGETPTRQNVCIKNCLYSYMFKFQSPSKYSLFDAIHLLRQCFHCSKQFLNPSILVP